MDGAYLVVPIAGAVELAGYAQQVPDLAVWRHIFGGLAEDGHGVPQRDLCLVAICAAPKLICAKAHPHSLAR